MVAPRRMGKSESRPNCCQKYGGGATSKTRRHVTLTPDSYADSSSILDKIGIEADTPAISIAADVDNAFNPCNPLIRANLRFRQRGIVGAYRGRDAPPTSSDGDSTDFLIRVIP